MFEHSVTTVCLPSAVRRAAIAGLLSVAVLAGCGRPPAEQRTISIDDEPWTVLVADRDGMRGRDGFDGADGMLFDLGRDMAPGSIHFVMDGVAFPLDIAWFTDAGGLVGTTTMATCPAKPCPKYAPDVAFRWAVEAPVGAFDDLGRDARIEVP
jgi:uncharacterized membrane protein (UPF0127 family)